MSDTNSTLDGFELLNCIATGNLSQVWEVKEIASGQSYAMKLLLEEALADPDWKQQLKHEANVGRSAEHPNLITIYDTKISKTAAYFTMELFRGDNLKTMIRGDLSGAQVRAQKIIECVAQALAALHEKGWVHKDIKPDNILVTRGSEVRVIDFSLSTRAQGGLAKMLGSKKKRIIQGTRSYIAPEWIRKEPTTTAVDMYSLGITLYEILVGRPPFVIGNPNELLMAHIQERPEPPSTFNSNVTPELEQLVLRMLAKKPADRPANMQELCAELRSISFFKTDPVEFQRTKDAEAADTFKDSMAHRLDSRSDAERTPEEREAAAAVARERAERRAKALAAAAQAEAESKGPAPQPAAPVVPPVPAAPPPMMPAAYPPPPAHPMPPGAYPQQPAYPMAPMPPGAYPAPPAPYPPGVQPPGMVPGGPPAPQPAPPHGNPPPTAAPTETAGTADTPPPADEAPQAAEPPKPSRPVLPRRKTVAPIDEDAADLPLMDELPDVM